MTASNASTLQRLEAFKTGEHPYNRPLGAPTRKKIGACDTPERRASRQRLAGEVHIRHRVQHIRTHADALLDLKAGELATALRDPAQWQRATEALADAAEAIAQMQATVARMEPQ